MDLDEIKVRMAVATLDQSAKEAVKYAFIAAFIEGIMFAQEAERLGPGDVMVAAELAYERSQGEDDAER